MFEENPKIDLFPICFKYFQNVKSDMGYNEDVFNQWLKIQKLKYPHRLTYQRMKLEDFPRDPLKGIRMWSIYPHFTNYFPLCPFEDNIPPLIFIFPPLYWWWWAPRSSDSLIPLLHISVSYWGTLVFLYLFAFIVT